MSEDNWNLLIKEYEHLIGRQYKDDCGQTYKFFGLVHSDDDFYYGMTTPEKKLRLLSCVGHIEDFGMTLIDLQKGK